MSLDRLRRALAMLRRDWFWWVFPLVVSLAVAAAIVYLVRQPSPTDIIRAIYTFPGQKN